MDSLEQTYQNTLDFLYSFVDFSMKRHVDDSHRFFKLDRMVKLMELLKNPQYQFQSIHIAGTKGKGSTASMIASVFRAADYKVGLYTSPHLEEFTERILVNGEKISKEALISLVEKIKPLTLKIPDITTFELTTAIAFLFFEQQQVDIAVLEVGLGGRLDATNIIKPVLTVITPISYDHTAVLGNTLTEIAFEKGGIIKPDIPVIIAPQKIEAQVELERICEERHSPVIYVDKEYKYRSISHTLSNQTIEIEHLTDKNFLSMQNSLAIPSLQLNLPLLGFHQVQNTATVIATLDAAINLGFSINRTKTKKGINQVYWPARFEILREIPPIVIDSAHNGDSMERLHQAIDEYFPGQRFILIFGASADKQIETMLEHILPRIEYVITTRSTHPRAADPEYLAKLIESQHTPVKATHDIETALSEAMDLAGNDVGILVTGSVFIAAAARSVLKPIVQIRQH